MKNWDKWFLCAACLSFLTACASTENLLHLPRKSESTINPIALTVTLNQGDVLAPQAKQFVNYQPITFKVLHDSCTSFSLSLQNKETLPLKGCYKKNLLFIGRDQALQRSPIGGMIFYENALWQSGYTYHNITAPNNAFLSHINVTIILHSASS